MLFILALEPLAITVRINHSINDIKIKDCDHRIVLYTNNTILQLTNLERSVPLLLKVIDRFGKFSGYKVNNANHQYCF